MDLTKRLKGDFLFSFGFGLLSFSHPTVRIKRIIFIYTSMRKSDIKAGTKLYKQSTWDIFEYEVIQIQTLETKDHKQNFYIVKCNSCVDHEACEVALKINDDGHFEYSHMINNYEDEYLDHCEDCKRNSQYYWHIELGKIGAKVFFLSKKDCMIDTYERARWKYEEDIKEFELKISNHKKHITLLSTKIGALKYDTPTNE